MGKIMGLDVGEKTIGVAFCEEGTTLAFPGKTLWRQEGKKRDMAALRQLVAANDVKRIVVGMPLTPDGARGPQAAKVEDFLVALRNSVRIPIIRHDERLSTQEAAERLTAANHRREDHKQTIDSVAAALILQWHLDEENNAGALLAVSNHEKSVGALLAVPIHAAPDDAVPGNNTILNNTAPNNAASCDNDLIHNHQSPIVNPQSTIANRGRDE